MLSLDLIAQTNFSFCGGLLWVTQLLLCLKMIFITYQIFPSVFPPPRDSLSMENSILSTMESQTDYMKVWKSWKILFFLRQFKIYAKNFFTEHILKTPKAAWFSPSGSKLLYAMFDDTEVGTVSLHEFETDPFVRGHPGEPVRSKETFVRYSKVKLKE